MKLKVLSNNQGRTSSPGEFIQALSEPLGSLGLVTRVASQFEIFCRKR